jgi:hypothetical protein
MPVWRRTSAGGTSAQMGLHRADTHAVSRTWPAASGEPDTPTSGLFSCGLATAQADQLRGCDLARPGVQTVERPGPNGSQPGGESSAVFGAPEQGPHGDQQDQGDE